MSGPAADGDRARATADAPGLVPLRDAASLILLHRDARAGPCVLMGRRPAASVFMPGRHVFPGGAVDAADHAVPLLAPPPPLTLRRAGPLALPLCLAAIRELWEETGLILGRAAVWTDAPAQWAGFAAQGHRPDGSALRLMMRAVTPPGQPRRFDARFFLAEARALWPAPQGASPPPPRPPGPAEELEDLRWLPLAEAAALDLHIVTRRVLAAATRLAALPPGAEPARVPHLAARAPRG